MVLQLDLVTAKCRDAIYSLFCVISYTCDFLAITPICLTLCKIQKAFVLQT